MKYTLFTLPLPFDIKTSKKLCLFKVRETRYLLKSITSSYNLRVSYSIFHPYRLNKNSRKNKGNSWWNLSSTIPDSIWFVMCLIEKLVAVFHSPGKEFINANINQNTKQHCNAPHQATPIIARDRVKIKFSPTLAHLEICCWVRGCILNLYPPPQI